MKITQISLKSLVILAVSLIFNVQAQVDPMTRMSLEQMMMQMNQYDQQMNQWIQQQMQQSQMQLDQAYAEVRKFYIEYYRQQTGDYTTPDQQALVLGDQLYCQHYPVKCQEIIQQSQQIIQHNQAMTQISAQGHQQRMQDIQSWGNTQNQIGQTYSDILDMSHQGYMDRSASQDQSQANYVQGAIYGEANYYNSNGSVYSLPIYPDPNMSYTTPEGYPLYFDSQSNTWYHSDGNGWWIPLNQQQ